MTKFYNIEWTGKVGEVIFNPCVEYNSHTLISNDANSKKPLRVKATGKNFYDIVRLKDPFNFSVSKKILEDLIKYQLNGWSYYDLIIENCNESYYGFQVLGRSGKLVRPYNSQFVIGCEFDHKSWDGSDFFSPEGTLLVFCTERAKDILFRSNIRNISIVDTNLVKWYSA